MSKNRPTVQEKSKLTENSISTAVEADAFSLDAALLQEIAQKGLEHRWVNATKLQANFGHDPRSWMPYRRETAGNSVFGGTDSEGYVRRGDLILCVQSKEVSARRKARVEAKNAANKAHIKQSANQLKESFRQAGIKAKITEGYDEE